MRGDTATILTNVSGGACPRVLESVLNAITVRFQLKNTLHRLPERLGDAQGQYQRRVVAAGFQGDYRLAGYAHADGQLLLGHLVVIEPQAADSVLNSRLFRHGNLVSTTLARASG